VEEEEIEENEGEEDESETIAEVATWRKRELHELEERNNERTENNVLCQDDHNETIDEHGTQRLNICNIFQLIARHKRSTILPSLP